MLGRLAKLQINEDKRRELELRKEQERLAQIALKEQEREEKARRLAEFKSGRDSTVHHLKQEIDRKMEKGSRIHGEHIGLVKEKALAVSDKAREVAARKTPQKRHGSPQLLNYPVHPCGSVSQTTHEKTPAKSPAAAKNVLNDPVVVVGVEDIEEDQPSELNVPWFASLTSTVLAGCGLDMNTGVFISAAGDTASDIPVLKSVSMLSKELSAVLTQTNGGRSLAVVEQLCTQGCRILTGSSGNIFKDVEAFFVRKLTSSPSLFMHLLEFAITNNAGLSAKTPCTLAFVAKLLTSKTPTALFTPVAYHDQLPATNICAVVNLLGALLRQPLAQSQSALHVACSCMTIIRCALVESCSQNVKELNAMSLWSALSSHFQMILDSNLFELLRGAYLMIGAHATPIVYMDFIGSSIALLETMTALMT
jgi:hypothetical protein